MSNIAFLFDSDDLAFNGMYSFAIQKIILTAGILSRFDREMRISLGDILTFSIGQRSGIRTHAELAELDKKVFMPAGWFRLKSEQLGAMSGKRTVYCWLFENMTEEIAGRLSAALWLQQSFLGAMEVNFARQLHLVFFRNSLVEKFRLSGNRCSLFFSLGENEDPDVAVQEIFEECGYAVEHEDIGARRTIFDDYDTIDHFRRVEDFRRIFSVVAGWSREEVSDLIFVLEELHPRLFDILASAFRSLERAETAEDFAQVSLSGRRFLEDFADFLYPPRDKKVEGREVGATKHKNRLWLFITDAMNKRGNKNVSEVKQLGDKTDKLFESFNAGLHSRISKEKVVGALIDLATWARMLIELDRPAMRKPYLAYNDEIIAFAKQMLDKGTSDSK